jgi:hypothetical protein
MDMSVLDARHPGKSFGWRESAHAADSSERVIVTGGQKLDLQDFDSTPKIFTP